MNRKVVELKRRKQYEQRTPEWYDIRRTLVTASSAGSLLERTRETCESYVKEYKLEDIFDYNGKCCNPYSSKTQFILDKCKQGTFKGNVATFWGQKYEPVVTDIYSNLTDKIVMEFGLIKHKTIDFLGASPDGITPDGIMIEIKCPFRRKITGIPPLYYWIQVQLQLEVCDLEYCDFVEFEFTEYMTEEEFLDDTTLDVKIHNKGIVIHVEKQDDPNIPCPPEDIQYIYPEKEILDNVDALINWKNYHVKNLPDMVDESFKNSTLTIIPVYWKATDKSILRIKRDRKWFENVAKKLGKEWNYITYFQKGENYTQLISKEKVYTKGTTVFIDTEEPVECVFNDTDDDSGVDELTDKLNSSCI